MQLVSFVLQRAHVLNPYFKSIRRIIPFYFKVIKYNYLHRQLLKLSVTKTEFVLIHNICSIQITSRSEITSQTRAPSQLSFVNPSIDLKSQSYLKLYYHTRIRIKYHRTARPISSGSFLRSLFSISFILSNLILLFTFRFLCCHSLTVGLAILAQSTQVSTQPLRTCLFASTIWKSQEVGASECSGCQQNYNSELQRIQNCIQQLYLVGTSAFARVLLHSQLLCRAKKFGINV
ncbi:Hypothetical_protein [Hexamita inflata]|uniref:Hypothetical_protein n=1 Tax=Hexamita inflata TaxID=28002 RepID=A0AA86PYB2_9EUKA|nr:Hypothetical protein HINF_LOCUS35946 [Hexamita inflata]